MKNLLLGAISAVTVSLIFVTVAGAGVDKILWCHTVPNGNSQTLNLPLQALEQAGHVNAEGNPLHAGDHPGECEEPTPTIEVPTVSPTVSPSPTISPTIEVSPTSSPTETPQIDDVTPTEELKQNTQSDGRTDGRSDGRSDGKTDGKSPQFCTNCGWK